MMDNYNDDNDNIMMNDINDDDHNANNMSMIGPTLDSYLDLMPQEASMTSTCSDDDQDNNFFPVIPLKKNLSQMFDCEIVKQKPRQSDSGSNNTKRISNMKVLLVPHKEVPVESNNNNTTSFMEDNNNIIENNDPSNNIITTNDVASKIRMFETNQQLNQKSSTSAIAALNNKNTGSSSSNKNDTGGLTVFLRIRPMSNNDTTNKSTIEIMKPTSINNNPLLVVTKPITKIRTFAPETSNAYKVSRTGDINIIKEYEFTQVFDDKCSQRYMYQHTVQPLISGVINDGQSALIFCYGITNAGKTYTTLGPEKELLNHTKSSDNNGMNNSMLPISWGLVPRTLHELLSYCQSNNTSATLQLSYFEIYNETIIDLLVDNNNNNNNTTNNNNTIHADCTTGIRGLQRKAITKLSDGIAFIALANKNRRSGTNNVNNDSSRSHAICQFHLVHKSKQQNNNNEALESDLWIVDLAGSERSKRTGGTRRQEAADINKSLMTLNRCLTALRLQKQNLNANNKNNNNIVIPYRDSKLTQIFGHHFISKYSYRTTMIVNVNPSIIDFDETQQVLSYAAAAKNVQLNNTNIIKKDNNTETIIEYDLDGRKKVPSKQTLKQLQQQKQFSLRNTTTTTTTNNKATTMMKAAATTTTENNNNIKLINNNNRKRKNNAVDTNDEALDANNNNHSSLSKKLRTQGTSLLLKQDSNSNMLSSKHNNNIFEKSLVEEDHVVVSSEGKKLVKRLQMELSVSFAENSVLTKERDNLLEKMKNIEENVETEVRQEVSEEMERIIERYEKMIYDLKVRGARDSNESDKHQRPSSFGSMNDNNNDGAMETLNTCIYELQGQVQECEDEMKRIQENHIIEIKCIHQNHINEINTLKNTYENQMYNYKEEVQTLIKEKESLLSSINQDDELQDAHDELLHSEKQIAVLQLEKIDMLLQTEHNNNTQMMDDELNNKQTNEEIISVHHNSDDLQTNKMVSSSTKECEVNYNSNGLQEIEEDILLSLVVPHYEKEIEEELQHQDMDLVEESVVQSKEEEEFTEYETKVESNDEETKEDEDLSQEETKIELKDEEMKLENGDMNDLNDVKHISDSSAVADTVVEPKQQRVSRQMVAVRKKSTDATQNSTACEEKMKRPSLPRRPASVSSDENKNHEGKVVTKRVTTRLSAKKMASYDQPETSACTTEVPVIDTIKDLGGGSRRSTRRVLGSLTNKTKK